MPAKVFVPLRIALKLAALAMVLPCCLAAHGLWRLAGRASPWPRAFLGATAWCAGVDVRREGQVARAPLLLLANHISWVDFMALAGATGSAFVAHSGLAVQPLRFMCELNRTIFIDRNDRAAIAGDVRRLRAALTDGAVLTLFPEGTTGDGITLGGFKSSLLAAFEPFPPGICIQPVWLDYGRAAGEIAWYGAESGIANFLRVLGRAGPLVLTLHFLRPLTGAEGASRKTIAAAAQARIAAVIAAGACPDQRVAL